MTENPESVFK